MAERKGMERFFQAKCTESTTFNIYNLNIREHARSAGNFFQIDSKMAHTGFQGDGIECDLVLGPKA